MGNTKAFNTSKGEIKVTEARGAIVEFRDGSFVFVLNGGKRENLHVVHSADDTLAEQFQNGMEKEFLSVLDGGAPLVLEAGEELAMEAAMDFARAYMPEDDKEETEE